MQIDITAAWASQNARSGSTRPPSTYVARKPPHSYDNILAVFGFLPHFWQAQGSRPEVIDASLKLWYQIYRNGVLPPGLKEEILLAVSAANTNSYCIITHPGLLKQLGVDMALEKQIARDFERASVTEKEKAGAVPGRNCWFRVMVL